MTTHKPLLTLSLIIQILVGYKMNWAKHSCSKHGNHLFSLWLDMFLSSLLQKCLLSSRGRSYASVCRWLLKRSVGFWRRWRLNTRPRSPVPTRGSNIATGCWTSRWKQRRIYTVRFFFKFYYSWHWFYSLAGIFSNWLFSCLVYKMSENGEKCWWWRPFQITKIFSLLSERCKETQKMNLKKAESKDFDFFLMENGLNWGLFKRWQIIDLLL